MNNNLAHAKRAHNMCHYLVHNLANNLGHNRPTKGSILIWSMMLGFILASVFFIFAMRQRAAIAAQRDTMAILSAKEYLGSYAEYIEGLSATDLAKITSPISLDGITGTVTNKVSVLTGIVDFGKSVNYKPDANNTIIIEWNKCPTKLFADLYFNDILHKNSGSCSGEYGDMTAPIAITKDQQFTIKTSGIPFYYRITAKDSAVKLTDDKWYMDLSIDLVNGKKYTVKRGF